MKPFLWCAAITLLLVVAGSAVFEARYREMLDVEGRAGRLTHLDGVIMRLDETQTMYAKMAAATGDPKWEQGYEMSAIPLNAALAEALSLEPELAIADTMKASQADAVLGAMDQRAFELVHAGNLREAAAVFGPAYDEQRDRYTDAMSASMKEIAKQVQRRIDAHRHTMTVAKCVGAAALICLALLWLNMLSLIRRYIRERGEAEDKMRAAQASLEDRVVERTREVEANREQYRYLVENIDAIPFEWEPATHRLLYLAPQAARLLECPPEALRNEDLIDQRIHPEDRTRFQERIDRFVAGDYPCTIDFRMLTDAGRVVTVRMCLGGRAPNLTSFGVLLDITTQTKLESELQQSQKLESVGRLAAGVAHEINTPVQFITDSMQFIRDSLDDVMRVLDVHRRCSREAADGAPSATRARDACAAEADVDIAYLTEHMPQAVDLALEGLSRVTTIVRSMKVFAHPDRPDKALIDLNESLASTLTIAQSEYRFVADLVTDLGPLPKVACYAGDLNQVFLNLLVNASHAIADVLAVTGARGRITVTTRREAQTAVIAISDTGTGIPVAIRDRIFDPFFTTKEVGRGTGQGLSHARSIVVDKHGGSLTFETDLGAGTTFYIRLPIDETAERELAA